MEDKPQVAVTRHEGFQIAKISENKYISRAAIAIVLILSIQFIPQVNDFWNEFFVNPIMADSKGEAGAKYNIYNTVAYGLGFFVLFMAINELLTRWKIELNEKFIFSCILNTCMIPVYKSNTGKILVCMDLLLKLQYNQPDLFLTLLI